MTRKFYRLWGLSQIFKISNNVFQTSVDGMSGFLDSFITEYQDKIDKHTLLFLTATEQDAGKMVQLSSTYNGTTTTISHKLKACDTLIWVRGQVYAISTKTVTGISYNVTTYKMTVNYSDGTSEELTLSGGGSGATYTAGNNITISDTNVISAIGYLYNSETKNFIEDNNTGNAAVSGTTNVVIFGEGNTANLDNQTVLGKFNTTDSKQALVLGWGDNYTETKNIFTVSITGVVYSPTDVTAGGVSDEVPDYKLSDIHSVKDSDWVVIGFDNNSFSDESYDESYE